MRDGEVELPGIGLVDVVRLISEFWYGLAGNDLELVGSELALHPSDPDSHRGLSGL
jgi:hypothetical protein